MRRLIFLLAFLFLITAVKAQNKLTEFDAGILSDFIFDNIDYNKIKDSTAFYAFSLKIDVETKNNQQQIDVKINNPIIAAAFNNLDTLKKINYSKYFKNGKAKILARYYVMILSSDYQPTQVDIYKIPSTIKYFFEEGDNSYIDMGSLFGIMIDKTVYD